MDNHKGVTADKKKRLGIEQKIQEREKELQELRKAVETLKSSAQTAVEDSERVFTEMIRSIEKRRSEVTELIRAQEKAEVSRAEGLLKRLEQEIAELKRRDAELEQLSHTVDHIDFLKNAPSVRDVLSMTLGQSFSFEALKESVSALRAHLEEKLDGIFEQNVAKISAAVSNVQASFSEPVTREEFLKYFCRFTLDPNTANRYLHLSEGNRRVEYRAKPQSYPDHPERFDEWWPQVLSREGVSGRCYWELEWHEEADIAVSYKSISRKGEGYECGFGASDQSWSLTLCSSSTSFWHSNKETKLPLVISSRIGVYVDHKVGTLAFYSISDTMTLLHRVQTSFTDALYPGFFIHFESSVRLL